jgi:hypothetical protein
VKSEYLVKKHEKGKNRIDRGRTFRQNSLTTSEGDRRV